MSLRYLDSFDHYDTAALTAKWNVVTTAAGTSQTAIVASGGRNGSQCMRLPTGGAGLAWKVLDFQQTWCIGFAFKTSVLPSSAYAVFFEWTSGQQVQCSLGMNSSHQLEVRRGGATAITGGTSTNTVTTGTWYYVEFGVTISASIPASTCYVNVGGVNWITVPAGQNLEGDGITAGADGFAFVGISGSDLDFDDLYVCDAQAGATGPFGNMMVQCIYPNADGATNDWTASTNSRSSCVDEALANGDTDYIYYATTGGATTLNAVQLFDMQNLTYTPTAITGIQWNCYARKSDAGYRYIERVIRSNATTNANTATNNSLGIDYQTFTDVLETDPCNSNAAWNRTSVDALQAGVILSAFG